MKCTIFLSAAIAGVILAAKNTTQSGESATEMTMKSESFNQDLGWLGVNNRPPRTRDARLVRQDFGFSADTRHAGGAAAGERGGFVSPDGQIAFFGKAIERKDLRQPLSASGTLSIGQGGTHLLLGFFNSETVNEWRTPNTIAIRLNGRGEKFFAYVEYCTSKWRAGGDTTPFPSVTDEKTGRVSLIGFPCDQPLRWTLNYDPRGNSGQGIVRATIGESMAICKLDDSHENRRRDY